MMKKVKEYVNKEHMIQQGDAIVVGVSGGADSVYLLLFLCAIKEEYHLKLQVVHINHQLRVAADKEEEYVRSLCEKLEVKFEAVKVDVYDLAKREKMTLEEAARELRYAEFSKWLEQKEFTKIAVAHHMNDQAETFLFRVARGTGLVGMQGMKPIQDTVIRPLLCMKKEDILAELKEQNVIWMEDESNLDDTFARNKIRNVVIPELCKVNERVVEHIFEVTQEMKELTLLAKNVLDEKYTQLVRWEDGTCKVAIDELKRESEFVQKHTIKKMLEQVAGRKKDITKAHVKSVQNLLEKEVAKQVDLVYGMVGKRTYTDVEIGKKANFLDAILQENVGELVINEVNPQKQRKKDCIQIVDYDKIKDRIVLRYRKEGDYLIFHKNGSKKSLNRFFIDQKIPRDERDRIPVVADGHNIIWVVGYRLSENYKITDETKRYLELQYLRRSHDE